MAGNLPDPWLTPRDITEQYQISKATLSEWRAKRVHIPFRQIGRAIHYRKSDVEAFVTTQMVKVAS